MADNLGGYEESDAAALRVVVPPILMGPRLDLTNFIFNYQSESNVHYILQFSDSFAATNRWLSLATNVGTGQISTQIISTNGRPSGLFRLRVE